MKQIQIEEKIILECTKCTRDFECVGAVNDCTCINQCRVDQFYDNRVLVVQKTHSEYCPYNVHFGYSDICRCPARREIYRRYKI